MKLLRNKLVLVIIFAFVFFVVDEGITYYLSLEQTKKEYFQTDKKTYENLLDAQEKNVAILAEALSSDKTVIEAYKKNDPQLLVDHVKPIWKNVQAQKLIYEIHFFKPPAVSFVNFSNLNAKEIDISDVRKDIVWVTSSFKPSTHTFVCRSYVGLRATEPIVDEKGKMLGGLSLGKKIDWLPESLKKATGHDAFLIYKKSAVSTLLFRNYQEFMKDKILVDTQYILADTTTHVDPYDVKQIDFSKDIQDFSANGIEYTLFRFPIVDFNGKVIAYLFSLNDMHSFYERFRNNVLKNFFLVFITSLIVILIIRKKNSNLIRYIRFLKELTGKIKHREFDALKQKRAPHCAEEVLMELEDDIIEMGKELEQHYNELVCENREKSKKIIEQYYTDSLTGLKNRNALFEELEKDQFAYIAIFNIRNFKEINDAFGFAAGNYILKELAEMTREYVGHVAKTYRLASDEFVIKSSNAVLSKREFELLVQSFIKEVENKTFQINLKDISIEVHINIYAGICFDFDQRLEKADRALSQAKKLKKTYVIYTEKENTKEIHLKNIQTINEIAHALQEDAIVAFFQPIVNSQKEVTKYESLVRMKRGKDIISPAHFLEVSQKTKYYKEISKRIIQKSFDTFRDKSIEFSINLTADDIVDEEIIALIRKELLAIKESSRVVFELVESDDLSTLEEIEEFIKFVRNLGAKIAIDDFGSGYSNFSYIIKIKPDYLKIDGSLIHNIHKDKNALQIVQTIVEFSKKLDIKTVAEFIHSHEVFEVCREIGVDEFQGYYIGEPKEDPFK